MPLPAKEKTYEFITNQIFGASGAFNTDHRSLVWGLKDALISPSFTAPWTVAGSSDGSTGAMDATDRWIDPNDLIWQQSDSSARSWIVFNTHGGRQLLWECRGQGGTAAMYYHLRIKSSAEGLYTGGSVTATPTATDEYTHLGLETFFVNIASGTFRGVFHVIKSTDGEMTMYLVNYQNVTQTFYMLAKVQDPVAGFTHPWAEIAVAGGSGGSEACDYASLRGTQQLAMRDVVGGVNFSGALSCEGFLSDAVGQEQWRPNYFNGEYPMLPMGAACSNLSAGMGRHGRIPDVFYTMTNIRTGATLEANSLLPTRQWALFGSIWVPWDGSIPVTY